jgi:hypothetical protein
MVGDEEEGESEEEEGERRRTEEPAEEEEEEEEIDEAIRNNAKHKLKAGSEYNQTSMGAKNLMNQSCNFRNHKKI